MKRIMLLSLIAMMVACAAEPGSEKWCAGMKEKDKGEWTTNDAKVFAKNCIL